MKLDRGIKKRVTQRGRERDGGRERVKDTEGELWKSERANLEQWGVSESLRWSNKSGLINIHSFFS